MNTSDYPKWIPATLYAIEGKTEKEQVEILLAKIAKIAYAMEGATARDFQRITGAPIEECSEALGF